MQVFNTEAKKIQKEISWFVSLQTDGMVPTKQIHCQFLLWISCLFTFGLCENYTKYEHGLKKTEKEMISYTKHNVFLDKKMILEVKMKRKKSHAKSRKK